jgi:cell cycle sensor histidine kinase DivJ
MAGFVGIVEPQNTDVTVQRRRFAFLQLAKAGLGALLAVGFLALVHRPDAWEAIAMAGLVAPAGLAALAYTDASLAALELSALALFAALIGYLATLTGGLLSPLTVWFVLVPAEAALSGGRPAVLRAGMATGAVLLAVTAVQAAGLLPHSLLPFPGWEIYAASVLAAVVQAAFVAVAAQDRQRAADQAATDSAAMYRFLADNAMDLITRHGTDGRILFASPAAQSLLGERPQDLEGMAPTSLVHLDDLKILQGALTEASYYGRPSNAEVRLKRRDGSYVWTEMRCRPSVPTHGERADLVVVTRDISQRKHHERALIEARDLAEAASRAKSKFLANMSHELRTPLNAIIGFSEVMSREMFGALGSPRYLEYTRLINESGSHLLELINGVLDMSKIEAGKFDLSEELFDFADVAKSALRFVKLPADRKGVILKAAVAQSASTIFADRRAVKQILINLLTNGIKFTPRGGEVRISAVRATRGIEIAIADSGVGISAADLERLGQPFEQVEGEHVRSQEGTGLGLALVRALAQKHGGDAVIESTLGEGTIVRVLLPFAAVSANGDRIAEPAPTEVTQPSEELRGAA